MVLLLRAIKEIIETPPTLMEVRFEIDGGEENRPAKTLDNFALCG